MVKAMVVSGSLSKRIKACGVDVESADVNMIWLDEFNNNIDPKVICWDEDSEEHYYKVNDRRIPVEFIIVDETDTFYGSLHFPYHTPGWSLSGLLYLLNEYDGREFSLFCRDNRWYVKYGDMETTEGENHPEGACILFLEQFKDKLSKTNSWIG